MGCNKASLEGEVLKIWRWRIKNVNSRLGG